MAGKKKVKKSWTRKGGRKKWKLKEWPDLARLIKKLERARQTAAAAHATVAASEPDCCEALQPLLDDMSKQLESLTDWCEFLSEIDWVKLLADVGGGGGNAPPPPPAWPPP